MKIYLVRHGESLSSDVDPNQGLSVQGIRETEAMAFFLKRIPFKVDEILHSTKLRAKQTAEILARLLAPDLALIQREGLKPNDPIEPIFNEIRTFDQNVMIVSHLPFLEKLLTKLTMGEEHVSPITLCGSCLICLEGEGSSWQIAWVVSPKLFS